MNPSSMPQVGYSQVASEAFPTGWLVGALTVALGAFGAFAAFAAPLLFGPMAAAVIATERLLRASRARDARLIASWSALALGWIAFAACMVHAPLQSYLRLEAGLTLLVLGSGACWAWSRAAAGTSRYVDILPVAAGGAVALSILYGGGEVTIGLYGGGEVTIGRIAAAASVALALVGMEWVLMSVADHAGRAWAVRDAVVSDDEGGRLPGWTPRMAARARLPAEAL